MAADGRNSILLNSSAYFRFLWPRVAEYFRRERGSRIVVMVRNRREAAYAQKHFQCEDVVNIEDGYGFFDESVPADVYETAQRNEEKYGVLYSRIIMTDRHAGHAMSALGTGHPYSLLSKNVSQDRYTHYLNRIFGFWEDVCQRYNPWLMCNPGSGLWGLTRHLVAEAHGARVVNLAPPRLGDHYFWAMDDKFSLPGLEEEYLRLRQGGEIDPETVQECEELGQKLTELAVSNRRYTQYTIKRLPHELWDSFGRAAWQRMRGLTSYSPYSPLSNLASFLRTNLHIFGLNRMKLPGLDALNGRQFFLYCLQAEPETSTSAIAPDFNEQLAIIELVSKSLPADHCLVVKEHPFAVGRRPWLLYDLLRRLHNVVFVETSENSLALAARSVGVVTLSGTIGFEATLMGKPVLSMGMHNMYNCADNVEVVSDFMEVPGALRRIATMDETQLEKFRDLGPVFLQAYKNRCFRIPFELCLPESADAEDSQAVRTLLAELEKALAA